MNTFAGTIIFVCLISVGCHSAESNTLQTGYLDSSILRGEKAFVNNCSSCHNFRTDGIGPELSGITSSVNDRWLVDFIRNPEAMIHSGDAHAKGLFEKYHSIMPSFAVLPDTVVNDIVAFLHTHTSIPKTGSAIDLQRVTNPVRDTIAMSDFTIGLVPLVRIPASALERPQTRINKIGCTDGNMYVLDMRGKIYLLKDKRPFVYLDVAGEFANFLPQPGLATGLGSFAFHPEFRTNGLMYTTHTEPAATRRADFAVDDSIKPTLQWVLTEWKASNPRGARFSGSHRELLRIDMVAGMHGVQEICFDPEAKKGDDNYGRLFIGVGDGGSVESGFPHLAHQRNKVWGTILRIDPAGHNSQNGHYGIPSSNPFAGDATKLGEIFAMGFRNPNRISWSRSGQMLVTNIGQANIESLNIVHKGDDFGWPLREGPYVLDYAGDMKNIYPLPADDSTQHFSYPALQFDHDEGKAISGGFEYTGYASPKLAGKYVFGDIVSGRVFMANINDISKGNNRIVECRLSIANKPTTLITLCKDNRVDLRFGKDEKGELYILTKSDGMIYRIVTP